MSDIAAEPGVTASRIFQIRTKVLKLLHHGMRAQYNDQPANPEAGRTGAKLVRDAVAVANRSTLNARLARSTPLGEAVSAVYQSA
jgi:hypothetical protein